MFLIMYFVLLVYAAPQKEAPVPIVFTENIKQTEIADTLSFPARVSPKIQAQVLAEMDGVVEKLYVQLGEKVSKGQTLFALKQIEPGYEYQSARIRSQVKGVMNSIEVTVGTRVSKGKLLGSIVDPHQVQVFIEVPARDIVFLQKQKLGKIKFQESDKDINVRILGLSPVVDIASGTASCELEVIDKILLQPGRLGKVTFNVNSHWGLQLPEQAIVYKGKDAFVRLLTDNKAKYTPVKLGQMRNGKVEILEGLSENQEVILRANQYISEDEKVDVQKKESE